MYVRTNGKLADSVEVMAFVRHHPQKENITFPVLVPNLRGLEDAISSGATEIAIFGSASEGFSRNNINCSIEESLVRFKQVCEVALQKGIRVRGYIIIQHGLIQGIFPLLLHVLLMDLRLLKVFFELLRQCLRWDVMKFH
jgi:hypothetical protein